MRFTRVLVPLALAGALLAGCGGGNNDDGGTTADPPKSAAPTDNGVAALEPQAIVDKAVAALGAAKSFSVKGDISTDGQKFALDVKISGKDVLGSITLAGAKVELLRVSGESYIRPDKKMWELFGGDAGSTISQSLGTKWAKLSSKDTDFGDFFKITDPTELLTPDGTVTKGSTKTVGGVNAIGLVDKSKDGGTLYVATTGEPYPVMIEGNDASGQIAFSDFGATFSDIKAPAAAEVVDLDKLKSK